MATATAHRLKWFTPEELTKGYSREWRALIGADEEYVISEGGLRIVGNTRTVESFYTVSKGKIGAAKSERRNIGEALTLKDAKTLAQRHRDQTSGGLDLLD
jgi:hypothetical protein